MPHQAMSTKLDTVLPTEISDTVCPLPTEFTLVGLSRFRFHIVLSCDAVELLTEEVLLLGVGDISLVHGYADHEILLVNVLQTLGK